MSGPATRHPIRLISFVLIAVLIVALGVNGCQSPAAAPATPTQAPVTLTFTYWGSPVEKAAVEQMVRAFEAANPNLKVNALHFPNSEYIARVSALIAGGTPPDVGYLFETHAALWASAGKVIDMTDVVRSDHDLSSRIPETYYDFAPGKTLGTSTSTEIILMFYNKGVLDRLGLPYPPSKADEAWSWDTFVSVARQLTTDINGRRPGAPGFDPERVDVYGVMFDTSLWFNYYPFIYSNGGEIVNADGTRLLLDSAEATQAIQRLADLMWVHHVAPTPAQAKRLPSADVMLQTGKLAMTIGGQWKLLDYSSMQGLRVGVAVLPKMKQPRTLILGSPTVIFAGSQHLDAAIKLYKFHNDPKAVDLFARGLWMPLQKAYYTDPELIASWIDNPAHPSESIDAIVNYTLCCVVRTPHYYVKNFGQIADQVIQPAVDRVWNDEASAAEAMRQAVREASPLLAGRWDR